MVSYVEHAPLPALRQVLRTAWIQRTGESPYAQRHLPTGGVEISVRVGGEPRLLGPLTGAHLEIIAPNTTVVGVRFRPGAAPPLSAALTDLVDTSAGLAELHGSSARRLADAVTGAASAEQGLILLQRYVLRALRDGPPTDALVREATRLLMPWPSTEVGAVADRLGLSASQLRRRCRRAVGVGPKTLQRTLRFQGFLALAQAEATGHRAADRIAGLAVDAGYADQAHLSRECQRLTGVTPGRLLGSDLDRCACGHDHEASYRPFLTVRASFKTGARPRS